MRIVGFWRSTQLVETFSASRLPVMMRLSALTNSGTVATLALKAKLHQWLTQDFGHPKLREHLASIVSILKLSKTPDEFKNNVNIVHPTFEDNDRRRLDFGDPRGARN